MTKDTPTTAEAPRQPSGRGYLAVGLALGVAGPLLYIAQLWVHRLAVPWYLPVLGTAGALLLVMSLVRRRTAVRFIAVSTLR